MAISRPPGARLRASGATHPARLELDRRAGAIGLRGDHQIVIGAGEAAARPHLVEQEFVVLAIDHQHDRLLVDRIAAAGADPGAPVLAEEGLQLGDLRFEIVRGVAGQRAARARPGWSRR